MNRRGRGSLVAAGAVTALALAVAPAQAGPTVVQPDIPLPGATDVGPNNEITQGPDGNMWVTVANENAIVRITPDGTVTKLTPAGLAQPAFGIVSGPDGNLWAAQSGGVARIDPATGNTDQFNYGVMNGQGITVGPDGHIWFAATNALVNIPPATPNTVDNNAVTLSSPKGMSTGSDGLLWIADGTNVVSATADAAPVLTPYPVGGAAPSGTQDIAAGPNGQVAFANPVDDPQTVGLLSPGGMPQEFPLENTDPFGVTFGQDGAYWFSRFQGNDLLRLTTDGQITTLPWPTALAGPRKIATGPNNTLWTTLDLSDDIGRVTGIDPPPDPTDPTDPANPPPPGTAPETTISKAPDRKVTAKKSTGKAKVKLAFSATGNAPSFQCTLTKKGKEPKMRACTSPTKYKLKPAKYKFAVVATAEGLTDETPAVTKFKVVEP